MKGKISERPVLRRLIYASLPILLALAFMLRPAPPADPWAFLADFAERNSLRGGVIAYGNGVAPPVVFAFGTAQAEAQRPMTQGDRFKIASLTKPVTAEAILRLSDLGLIDLDQPLASVFPEILAAKDPRMARVTVRHLLQHRAGWDLAQTFDPLFMTEAEFQAATGWTGRGVESCTEVTDGMLAMPLQFDPGSTFAYSNLGYCWLGRLIEKVTRTAFDDAIRQLVPSLPKASLDLAQLTVVPKAQGALPQTAFVNNPRIIGAAGGLITDAASYYAFAAAAKDPRLYERPEGEVDPVFYGLGWRVRNLPQGDFLTHMGSMPGAFSIVIREIDGPTVVALFNGLADRPFDAFDEFLQALLLQGFPQDDRFAP